MIDVPTGRQAPEARAVIWGDLPPARRRSLEKARRNWPEGRLEDFEVDGKRYTDRATGTAYRRVHGDPLLGGEAGDVELFVLHGDNLLYLRREGNPGTVVRQSLGDMGGGPAGLEDAAYFHQRAQRP